MDRKTRALLARAQAMLAARAKEAPNPDGVTMGCAALQIAAAASLAKEELIAPIRAPRGGGFDDEDADARVRAFAAKLPLTVALLQRMRELHWPEQPEFEPSGRPKPTLQDALYPLWDGEDELFDITSLRGLEHCTALEVLELGLLEVKSLKTLGSLATLSSLSLQFRGKAAPLTPLAKLRGLKKLSVHWADDIEPLSGLPKLERLDLNFAKVTDLSALGSMPALKHVRIFWAPTDVGDVARKNAATIKRLVARKVKLAIEWPAIEKARPRVRSS